MTPSADMARPGAWFAVPSRLAASLRALPAGPVVLTCRDGRLARLAEDGDPGFGVLRN